MADQSRLNLFPRKKRIDFRKDYTVFIKKKKFFTSLDFLSIIQINSFTSISTTHGVSGGATARVSIKPEAKSVLVECDMSNPKFSSWADGIEYDMKTDPSSFFDELSQRIMLGWSHIAWSTATREFKYSTMRVMDVGIEPMDEIWIFAKTMNENFRTSESDFGRMFNFEPIFTGLVSSVNLNYDPNRGWMMDISCDDMLKYMHLSRIANRAAIYPSPYISEESIVIDGVTYTRSAKPFAEGSSNDASKNSIFTNLFAGQKIGSTVTRLAFESGIRKKFLTKRIEPIERVPFVREINGNVVELFSAQFKSRKQFCEEAAQLLNLEFFADEAGNIVLKIPSYDLGINYLDENNRGGHKIVAFSASNPYVLMDNPVKISDRVTKQYEIKTDDWVGTQDQISIADPSLIITASFTDTDRDIYTAVGVKPVVDYGITSGDVGALYTRIATDDKAVMQFGYRVLEPVQTVLATSPDSAATYGEMLLIKLMATRYSASVTMVEEPTIRVGQPIKVYLPETPEYPDGIIMIYYIERISRNISVNGTSTMSLTLTAGRKLGEPSIFAKAPHLYREYYGPTEAEELGKTFKEALENGQSWLAPAVTEDLSGAYNLNSMIGSHTTKSYTIQSGDSLKSISLVTGAEEYAITLANQDFMKELPNWEPTRPFPAGFVGRTLLIPIGSEIPSDIIRSQNNTQDSSPQGGDSEQLPTDANSSLPSVMDKLLWIWPTPGYTTITSRWGWRDSPIDGARRFHYGIDIGAPANVPAASAISGKVVNVEPSNTVYGNRLTIQSDQYPDVKITYSHLNSFSVQNGQSVIAGQQVGLVGYTGQVDPKGPAGAHLHFEVYYNGKSVDPIAIPGFLS